MDSTFFPCYPLFWLSFLCIFFSVEIITSCSFIVDEFWKAFNVGAKKKRSELKNFGSWSIKIYWVQLFKGFFSSFLKDKKAEIVMKVFKLLFAIKADSFTRILNKPSCTLSMRFNVNLFFFHFIVCAVIFSSFLATLFFAVQLLALSKNFML